MDTLHEGASELENDDFDDCNLEQPSTDKEQDDSDATGVDSGQELGTTLTTLQVKEVHCRLGSYLSSEDLPSKDDGSSGVDDEDISADDYDINLDDFKGNSSKTLHKWPTFHAEECELDNNSLRHTVSLPTAGKLVSAMKGSREKEGITPRKLSVSWAPDVYDPCPNSLSYCPKKKMVTREQVKRDKKSGKAKHKGKNSRGSGSCPKEKKQHYRKGETGMVKSSKGHKSSADYLDFDDDDNHQSPDSSCGSSYRGKSWGSRRFAYAEAL